MAIGGTFLGTGVADGEAKKAVFDSEIIDLVELALENDYDTEVIKYTLFTEEELLVFETDKGTYYFKPKKVASYRYEWVEVML